MKKNRRKIIIFILAGILSIKIIVTLVALPKITVDYVAKYNEVTKPVDFKEGENAADYYLKAGKLYKRPPEKLYSSILVARWSNDNTLDFSNNDPNDLPLMEKWLKSNKPALDQIKLAVQKPYCWFKRESEKGYTSGIVYSEIAIVRDLSQALIYSAKLKAFDNNFRSAIDESIVCYRVGQHYCRPELSIIEQLAGIRIKSDAIETAMDILFYSNPTSEELKYFQDSLQTILNSDSYVMSVDTEKIFLYDLVQRTYLDWIRGINRPAFRLMKQFYCMCGDSNFLWINAFVGPSRHKIIRQTDRLFEIYGKIKDKTQWKIHHQYSEQLNEIERINESNFFMELLSPSFIRAFSEFQKSNAQTESLITVLAILRFQADNSRLPATLEELVLSKYMENLPKDPYSEGNLIYRTTGDGFKLYSVGENFEDNNGEPIITEEETMLGFPGMSMPPGMLHAYPPSAKKAKKSARKTKPTIGKVRKTIYKDIIFWPVIENLIKYETIEK